MLSCRRNLQVLKLAKDYRHVRFETSDDLSRAKTESEKESLTGRSEILCDILNCSVHTTRQIIAKNKDIIDLNQRDFLHNAKFCSKFFKLSDLIECPWVLTLQPSLFQHRYFSLRELGFFSVTPHYILRFPMILKQTPKDLKEKGFPVDCTYKSDILTKYLNATNRTEINSNLQCMYKDGSNLQKIKEVMNAEFFSAKLECSIGKARQMLHSYATLRVQSIYNTDQVLNVLLSRFGFPVHKIFSYLSLLSIHHEFIEDFISEIPEILGVSTVYIVKLLPSLLRQQSDTLRKTEAILKNFYIRKDQLMCCPKVLSIAPETLHKRLTVVCSTEELAVLQSNKRFLWLIYNFKNINSRLKCLKDENMPCSINMFTVKKDTFDNYIVYNNTRTSMREVYAYLADVFKMTEKEILTRLHCYSSNRTDIQNFSALNSRKVIEFLLLSGVTKEQIFNGLEIVFYEIETVKTHFKNLHHHHACQPFEEWISHFNLIQLLIYTIEVIDYR